MSKPKNVWIAGINSGGLWDRIPIKARLTEEPNGVWFSCGPGWHKDEVYVEKLGVCHRKQHGVTTFASVDKRDVENWIAGINAAFAAVRELVS